MSWRGNPDENNDKKKEHVPMSKKFFTACVLILAGIVALKFALTLLAQFWGWLVLIGVIITAAWIAYRVIQARRDRW